MATALMFPHRRAVTPLLRRSPARIGACLLAAVAGLAAAGDARALGPEAAVRTLQPAGQQAAVVQPAPPAAETKVSTRIDSVTVYGSGARVTRLGAVTGSGSYVIAGLPVALDADSLRVRLSTGHVVSVETLARVQAVVPDARVQELRDALAALQDKQRALNDERDVANALKRHLLELTETEKDAHAGDVAGGRPSVEAWRASLVFVGTELSRVLEALRAVDGKLTALEAQLADAKAALGEAETHRSVRLTDVHLDVVADGPAQLQLEYLLGDAGWEPLYDLRTAGDGSSVMLQYRARIHQLTGEDWTDASLALSTAQPQRGAQGPEPRPVTVSVFEASGSGAPSFRVMSADDAEALGSLQALGYMDAATADASNAAPSPFAAVIAQGLSVQFRLPRAETILSREQPTTVLVGEQDVAVSTEHYVTPALDTTVWLRGRAKNATPWTLLPGDAAVYFGNDFIGHARFDKPVLPDQEFTLHLGADPGVLVTREQTEDLHEEPGFLGRRQTQKEGWRITLENLGAVAAAADGTVAVIVREAFPKATDQRIEVEITDESVPPSRDERWLKELDEQGVHTWLVKVPRGGKSAVAWHVKLIWPEDLRMSRQSRRP